MNDLVAHIVLIRERTSWETMEQYNKECEKRKARAEKFGTEYVAPKLEEFLPWTEVKRIRDSEKTGGETSKGFVSGIDVTDVDEIAKQEARKARFAKKVLPDDDVVKDGDETTKDNDDDKEDSTPTTDISRPDLPVTQCWDKEEMLGALRSDPPPELWIKPTIPTPPSEGTETEMGENDGDSDMKKETVRWVPEKIHLFSVDWAAFKQIRGKDLMSYFGDYGPTYVEWLGDLSCNVCFEDQHTARRALLSLGQDIPSPPPEDISTRDNNDDDDDDDDDNDETMKKVPPDFGNMTWRFCRRPVRKVSTTSSPRMQEVFDCISCLQYSAVWFFPHNYSLDRSLVTSMEERGR